MPLEKPVSVFDSRTGAELEFYETPQVNPKHRNAGRFLHIMIENIAGTVIVRLDIKEAKKVKDSTKSISDELKLENEFYSVTIDTKTSSISSIYSKKAKKEIVRQDAVVGFNGYIYDEYASQGGWNHQSGRMEGNTRLDLLATRSLTRPAFVLERGANSV